ncbi:MAG: tetratricopeptide repeat protein [Bacteroidales bacterium]|nr:tetratricopeptide repeat protein [Bacteroidales bacterium]
MKRRSNFRIGILVLMLGFMFTSSLFAQQKGTGEKQTQEAKDQRIKAIGIDSVPATIFPPRKELTGAEKEAQRLFNEGSMKGKSGDYTGAIEDFTQSLTLVENGNTYLKRGFAFLLSGQFPKALQDFTEVLRIFPSRKEAIFGLGIARFEMKDYAGAEVDLKQYLDLVNNNAMAFDYMAALCFIRQDFQCALQNYSDVIRCDSLYLDAYTNRAMIRHYLRDYKGALEDYNIAIKQNPNDKKIYNNRAAARMLLKDYKAALEDLDKAIELDPLYADAYNNRGRVRHYLGDAEGACADWHKALSFGIEASRDLIIQNCK